MASALQNLIFPPPPSLLITAMTIVNFASLSVSGLSEVRGKHMQYSKFWNVTSQTSPTKQIKLSSKTGMLIFYTPAFIAGVASFLLFPNENFRFLLLKSALTLHFFKRIFEVHLSLSPVGLICLVDIFNSFFEILDHRGLHEEYFGTS